MNLLRFFLLLLLFAVPLFQAEALVDYTEKSAKQAPQQQALPQPQQQPPQQQVQRQAPQGGGQSYTPTGMFELGTEFRNHSVELPQGEEQVDLYKFKGHFATNYDVFFEFEHWLSSSEALNTSSGKSSSGQNGGSSTHQGNPKGIVGFNWLEFGEGPERANIDLYAGLTFPASGSSAYGSSRSDKIFGVLTTKRFYVFALGLGYEMRLTGSPDREEEMAVGNLQKLHATVGWMVSPDIQMVLEGTAYTIKASDAVDGNKLDSKQSFGTLEPRLVLGINPMIDLHMGATFRTNKASKARELTAARLWGINGLYGNSLFAGLNFSL